MNQVRPILAFLTLLLPVPCFGFAQAQDDSLFKVGVTARRFTF